MDKKIVARVSVPRGYSTGVGTAIVLRAIADASEVPEFSRHTCMRPYAQRIVDFIDAATQQALDTNSTVTARLSLCADRIGSSVLHRLRAQFDAETGEVMLDWSVTISDSKV